MRILVVNSDRSGSQGEPINLGDAMLTDALVDALMQRGHDVSVAEFGQSARVGGRNRVPVPGVLSLLAAVRAADAVVVGGGTMLQDDGPALGGLPRLVAATSVSARLARRPLAFFGVGCDPVTRFWPRTLLKIALWRRSVWARDVASVERCRQMARSARVALGADAFLLADDHVARSSASSAPRSGAVLSLAGAEAAHLTDRDLNELVDRFGRVRFVAMSQSEPYDDRAGIRALTGCEINRTVIHDWRDVADELSSAEVVAASRMHALYLGMSRGAPLVAIGAKAKVKAFAHEFQIPLASSPSDVPRLRPSAGSEPRRSAARQRAQGALTGVLEEFATG